MQEGQSEPPAEFRVFKKGLTETSKGVFKFTEASGKKVMAAAAKRGNDIPIDYGHAMHVPIMFTPDPAEAGKAAGWLRAKLSADGDLIASKVHWTPRAKQGLIDKEWRYFSPTFRHTEDGEIEELLSVALTNLPATYNMDPLMASQVPQGTFTFNATTTTTPPQEAKMKTVLAALGLSETATEAEALAKLQAVLATSASVAQLSALTGKPAPTEALGVITAWKAAADQVPALTQRIGELESKERAGEIDALLSAGKKAGKVPPAYEAVLRQMPVAQLKAFLDVAVPVPGARPATERPAASGAVGLTAEERRFAELTGTSLEEVAKAKARRGGVVPEGTMTPQPEADAK